MAGHWGGCPWSPCPGPGPALHPALELHQGALSLLGGWFWERLTPPLTAIPPPKTTKAKYKIPMYPYLLPKSTSTADQLPFTLPGGQCATVQVRLPVSTRPHPSLPFSPVPPPILRDLSAPPWGREPHHILCPLQVLRSVDRWSAGTLESSILNAYLHTIRESQHFLYIEV